MTNTENFIEKAKKIHGDKYDYSETDCNHNAMFVKIKCLKHGIFYATPTQHLDSKEGGCKHCIKDAQSKKKQPKKRKTAKKIIDDNTLVYCYRNMKHWTPWKIKHALKKKFDKSQAIVYQITNKITNEFYIGYKNVKKYYHFDRDTKLSRLYSKLNIDFIDINSYLSSSETVLNAIIQYGKHNFTFEVLDCGTDKEMINLEHRLLTKGDLVCNPLCYNKSNNKYILKSEKVKTKTYFDKYIVIPLITEFEKLSSNVNLNHVIDKILKDFLKGKESSNMTVRENISDSEWETIEKHKVYINSELLKKLRVIKDKLDIAGRVFTASIIDHMISKFGIKKYITL